jgi:hypothetical protein
MDIFDVLKEISKRKTEFMRSGMNECTALKSAGLCASEKYHIPLYDIRKICGM